MFVKLLTIALMENVEKTHTHTQNKMLNQNKKKTQ